MNSDLYLKEICNKLFQNQISAWLDIQNNAAHAKYKEYSSDDIKLFIGGLRNFMVNYVA